MSYWEKRQEEAYKAGEMQVNQYFMRLEKAFNQAKRELQKTVESFYWEYAQENSLTYAEAQKRLDKAEIGELKDFIELAMKNIGKVNQDVNNMSIKAHDKRMNDCLPPILFSAIFKLLKVLPDTELDAC